MPGQTKITKFNIEFSIDKNIMRFNIPMNDIMMMQKRNNTN